LTITDNTAPTITVTPSDLTVECDGAGNEAELQAWLANFGGIVATDECGTVSYTHNFISLTNECGETGEALVVFTAIDDCGNTTAAEATFTIVDTEAPIVDIAAEDLSLECDNANQQAAIDAWLATNGGAVATDACSGTDVSWTYVYTPGDENTGCGATGSTNVTFTVTDACGKCMWKYSNNYCNDFNW